MTLSPSATSLPNLTSDFDLYDGTGDEDVSPPLVLDLTQHRGIGGVWDTFSAAIHNDIFTSKPISIIVKLVNLTSFPTQIDELDFYRTELSDVEARRDVLQEFRVFNYLGGEKVLPTCRGVIPRLLGLVGSTQVDEKGKIASGKVKGEEIWGAVLEDVGVRLEDGERRVPGVQ